METWTVGILLKPLLALVFFVLVVSPLSGGVRYLLPEGKLKAFITADRTTEAATRRGRIAVTTIMLALFAALIAYGIWLNSSH